MMHWFRIAAAVCVVGLTSVSCKTTEVSILTETREIPAFKAPATKALCVVVRPVRGFGDASIYLDGKLVSGTRGNSVTSFEVTPGSHLVLARIERMGKVKFNFKAGKVYYLLQAAYFIPYAGVLNTLSPLSGEAAASTFEREKGKLTYTSRDPAKPVEDLSAGEFEDEQKDYSKWAKENPEKARNEAEYPGY